MEKQLVMLLVTEVLVEQGLMRVSDFHLQVNEVFSNILRSTFPHGAPSHLLPAAVTTEQGSNVFQSRPSLEHRS